MPHVIKTTVALDGRHPAREVASIGEEKESLLSVWEKHVNTVDKYVDNYLEENKELSGDKPIGLETGINLQNLNANEIAILLEQKKKCLGEITEYAGYMQGEYLTGIIKQLEAALESRKHPLEEVFAKVKDPFKSVVKNNPNIEAEYAFRLMVGSPPSLDTVRAAVGWCSVTMGRKGQYPKLDACLAAAIDQATKGKGQRHGGDRTPFLEQPWVRLYKTHGLGFLLGQADKKYHEALGKEKEADQCREILGAIVYLGMALLVLEGRVA